MLELLVSPKRARKNPWTLFLAGLLYSSLSFFIVKFLFSKDAVLSKNSGLLIVFFTVLFSIILVYFIMRQEGKEGLRSNEKNKMIKEDWTILYLLVLLFLGFLLGFTLLQIIFPNQVEFNSQMETYCVIKSPNNPLNCFNEYNLTTTLKTIDTNPRGQFISLLTNNLAVSLTIIIFTLLFGAGVTFILVWNASIIASVIALSIKYKLSGLPLGLSRFLIHGIPEIMAYFVFALAGGMLSITLRDFIKHSLPKEKAKVALKRCAYLLIAGLIILIIAALIETYITPHLF